MKPLFHKEYCSKCGKAFDPALGKCPSCGTASVHASEARSMSEMSPLGPWREGYFFLTGWLGFQLLGTIFSLIFLALASKAYQIAGFSGASLKASLEAFQNSATYAGAVDFTAYIIFFCAFVSLLGRDIDRLFARFKLKTTYYGFLYVLIVYAFTFFWAILRTYVFKNTDTNSNQLAVVSLEKESPVLSIIVFGFLGPFCEECAYRVGLFGFFRRINRYLAYILTGLVFGFIHFHFRYAGQLSEWLALPGYIFTGLALAHAYERHGFGASYLAHVTLNLISIILTLSQA